MFNLRVENTDGQIITLTQDECNYQVLNIEGLNPPKADIYTKAVASLDGGKFKSSKLQMRNIVLTIKINGDAEANRLHLYEYFRTGAWCKVYYSNGSRNVYIEGYCETIECPLFTVKQQMQISIVCPNPYLKSIRTIYADISKSFGDFEFPFEIEEEGIEFSRYDSGREVTILNNGEIDNGIEITLTAVSGAVVNPIIYNSHTYDYLKLNLTLAEGDIIVINTNRGNKSVKKILNAIETNMINYLESGSTWLQLKVGSNRFTYTAESNEENLRVEFESNLLYEGV